MDSFTPVADALRTYWTVDKFWQGSLNNKDYTRFCIVGLTYDYNSFDNVNPLPKEFREPLSNILRDMLEKGIYPSNINDDDGREAVINTIAQWEESHDSC